MVWGVGWDDREGRGGGLLGDLDAGCYYCYAEDGVWLHFPYLVDMIRSGLIKNRTRKSSQSHGEYAPESSLQDPRRRQQG